MKDLINNIIRTNKINEKEDERIAKECGFAFLSGMYKARIEQILTDLETIKNL